MKNIAIFASGNGTNAQRIAEYFRNSDTVNISLILSNKPDAFVLKRAEKLGIPTTIFNKKDFYESGLVFEILKEYRIDFIILAGFLWFVPDNILKAFPRRIINIHPALLPKHGGKGMYGEKVHQAVIESGDTRTGITIHFVNDHYDEGEIIFQDSFEVQPGDTPDSIALKVHQLEYLHFPRIIENVIKLTSGLQKS
jgi:phosphoribosylglycinamide formyltransferase 1